MGTGCSVCQRVGQLQGTGRHVAVKAVEVGHLQALQSDGLQRMRTPDQAYRLATGCQAAAHIAAYGACAENNEMGC
ncbi:hypothetical protein D3C87_1811110 [compost metagenome]